MAQQKDAWDRNVEQAWRNRFDEQESEYVPSTNEMERMLDRWGWYKD